MDERLRYFRSVVDCHGVTEAARQLHISQPALSIALGKLEKELGTVLLVREPHRFALTAAGRLAYEYAAAQGSRKRDFLADVARLRNERPALHLGLIDSMADILCAEDGLLPVLERAYQVSLTIDASGRLLEAVRRRQLDYALVVTPPAPYGQGLRLLAVGNEPMLDVSAAHHPPRDRLITYGQGSFTHQLIEEAFVRAGRPFQPAMHSTSPSIIHKLVRLGRGHAVLPYGLIRDDLAGGILNANAIGPNGFARRPVSLAARRRHASAAQASDWLSQVLRRYATEAGHALAATPRN